MSRTTGIGHNQQNLAHGGTPFRDTVPLCLGSVQDYRNWSQPTESGSRRHAFLWHCPFMFRQCPELMELVTTNRIWLTEARLFLTLFPLCLGSVQDNRTASEPIVSGSHRHIFLWHCPFMFRECPGLQELVQTYSIWLTEARILYFYSVFFEQIRCQLKTWIFSVFRPHSCPAFGKYLNKGFCLHLFGVVNDQKWVTCSWGVKRYLSQPLF